MRYLAAVKLVCCLSLPAVVLVSCLKDDRCGKGYTYKNGYCYIEPDEKAETDASTSNKSSDAEQEDGESEQETVTGLGDSCTDQSQCADKEADYCLINPSTSEGYCTIRGCKNTAEGCPPDYHCCVLPEAYGGEACLNSDDYQTAQSMGACGT
ncbi:MAG: hypothetical protein JXA30_10635 [Deltaproteobacteria bacterium]|nr:hypothetical protein [Deltaproteobacteria bacterium]